MRSWTCLRNAIVQENDLSRPGIIHWMKHQWCDRSLKLFGSFPAASHIPLGLKWSDRGLPEATAVWDLPTWLPDGTHTFKRWCLSEGWDQV